MGTYILKIVIYGFLFVGGVLLIIYVFLTAEYNQYNRRIHFSDGLSRAAEAKSKVDEYRLKNGVWPINNQQLGLKDFPDISGSAVKSITVGSEGKITLTFNEKVGDGDTAVLTPTVKKAILTWKCRKKPFSDHQHNTRQPSNNPSEPCEAFSYAQVTRSNIQAFYEQQHRLPSSLEELPMPARDNESVTFTPKGIDIAVLSQNRGSTEETTDSKQNDIITLSSHIEDHVIWHCSGGTSIPDNRPANCLPAKP